MAKRVLAAQFWQTADAAARKKLLADYTADASKLAQEIEARREIDATVATIGQAHYAVAEARSMQALGTVAIEAVHGAPAATAPTTAPATAAKAAQAYMPRPPSRYDLEYSGRGSNAEKFSALNRAIQSAYQEIAVGERASRRECPGPSGYRPN